MVGIIHLSAAPNPDQILICPSEGFSSRKAFQYMRLCHYHSKVPNLPYMAGKEKGVLVPVTCDWQKFKGRFLWLSWTYFNCRSKICPGNICPSDVCPYQEYLSCYWPNFDETLKLSSCDYLEQISTVAVTFVQATFVPVTFVHISNISAVTNPILTKL